jgi:hypothetical protein
MKRLAIATLLALPLAAAAQVHYRDYRDYREAPMSRGELRDCFERDTFVRDRLATLEQEKRDNDRNWEALEREGARLDRERGRLDNTNAAAVADYNRRSDEHNRRVAEHNRVVGDMNARASMHNREAADVSAQCASRPYYFRDLDVVRRDYSTLR